MTAKAEAPRPRVEGEEEKRPTAAFAVVAAEAASRHAQPRVSAGRKAMIARTGAIAAEITLEGRTPRFENVPSPEGRNLALDYLDLARRFTALEDQADQQALRAEAAEASVATLTEEVRRLTQGKPDTASEARVMNEHTTREQPGSPARPDGEQ